MARTIVRMWTKDGYHKDVALLDERQVWTMMTGMETEYRHMVRPLGAPRVVIDPKQFPEAVEFEVIVDKEW